MSSKTQRKSPARRSPTISFKPDDLPIDDMAALGINHDDLESDDDAASILEEPPEGVSEVWVADNAGWYDHPLKASVSIMKEVGIDNGKEVDAALFEMELNDIVPQILSSSGFLCKDEEGDVCLGIVTPLSFARKHQDMLDIQKQSNLQF